MSDRYWCEHAWVDGGVRAGVLITVAGARITSVCDANEPASGDEVLRGLTIPGLGNAHSHSFQRALRGHTQSGTGSFWSWREQMYALANRLDPETIHALARATFGEMVLAGITIVGEFHYLHHQPDGTPYADANETGRAIIAAAAEAGIRLTLLDACYLHGGIDGFRDVNVAAWTERVSDLTDTDTVRIGAGIHSIRAVDPQAAQIVADWAGERPLHAHLSEQPAENDEAVRVYGATPAALMPLSPSFTAIHATHLTSEDIRRLAPTTICLCPTTERDLADGIGPARELRDAGARLSVGSDSHAVIDLFEEARAIELDERLATGVRGHHPSAELLTTATTGGYACLGWPDGGSITAGGLADFVSVATDSVRTAGTPAEAIVFAATAADVSNVVIAGERVVRDGAHRSLDVSRELHEAITR